MGTSTDAILFYGYCWDEEDVPDFEKFDEVGWDEWLARKRGIVNPWDAHPSEKDANYRDIPYEDRRAVDNLWLEANEDKIDGWRQARKDIENQYLCGISHHCSSDCAMPYVFLKGTEITAWRGTPRVILPQHVAPMDEASRWALESFCRDLEIDVSDMSPQWHLVSYWSY